MRDQNNFEPMTPDIRIAEVRQTVEKNNPIFFSSRPAQFAHPMQCVCVYVDLVIQ